MISVKNLSKKYSISQKESYYALRDSIAGFMKNPFNALAKNLRKQPREDFWALKDVSFDIKKGEVVGIIGRNGAGKTTLLKILSRITHPTEGEVRLRGRVGSLLEVGTGFHPELTGRENIYFNGSILGMKRREINKKFDEIVDFAGIDKFLDTPVKRFSSGMQVRLAFSVAAHLDPEILLVDEVLAVGDVQFQKKCLGKMKDVSKGGRTVLFVSHNMSAIRNLCKRTILLENGKILLDSETKEVIPYYLNQNINEGSSVSDEAFEKNIEGIILRNNPTIRLREIALFNSDNLPASTFYSDESIKIKVRYQCLTTVNDLRVVIWIVDEENRAILASQNVDDPGEFCFHQRDPGLYESFCNIEPNTFGEKTFYISVWLVYPKSEHLIINKVLKFDVKFKGYNNIQYCSAKNSFLRPYLKWKTDTVV